MYFSERTREREKKREREKRKSGEREVVSRETESEVGRFR